MVQALDYLKHKMSEELSMRVSYCEMGGMGEGTYFSSSNGWCKLKKVKVAFAL